MAILSITLYFITSKLIDHPGLTSPNISGMYLSVIGVVTATYNLLYVLFQLPSFTGPFWSLALEEQFYLSYPILLLLIKDENKRIFLSLALLIGVMSFDRRLGTLGWFFRIDPILGGVLLHHLVTKFQFQTYPSTHKWLTYVALFFLCILPRYMDSKFLISIIHRPIKQFTINPMNQINSSQNQVSIRVKRKSLVLFLRIIIRIIIRIQKEELLPIVIFKNEILFIKRLPIVKF
jgi:hypothetical protein